MMRVGGGGRDRNRGLMRVGGGRVGGGKVGVVLGRGQGLLLLLGSEDCFLCTLGGVGVDSCAREAGLKMISVLDAWLL